ncbi:hypothetical protein KORDIASMS9_02374 [Kordia sp. SMS9]|nr:hypothetical protein KORDIASMS9_02374 [Kordia sp. SMS9]
MTNITMNVLLRKKISISIFTVLCTIKITSYVFVSYLFKSRAQTSSAQQKNKFKVQNIKWFSTIRSIERIVYQFITSDINITKNQSEFLQHQDANKWAVLPVCTATDVNKRFTK